METRANYLLIGVFTLLGLLGALGFFVWLARFEIDRQYDLYDVYFDSVSGLGRAGEVRFNGLLVGQVLTLDLAPDDPGKVRVRIEVDAETPVTTETTAQLQVQGVTGVSFVSLSGGGAEGVPLEPAEGGSVPVIPTERSVVQTLVEDAPDLLAEAQTLIDNLVTLTGDETQGYITGILANVERASSQFDRALEDFSAISASVAAATDEIALFTARLDGIGDAVETTLGSVNLTLADARGALGEAEGTLGAATGAMQAAERGFVAAEQVLVDQVPEIADDIGGAAAALRGAVEDLRARIDPVLAGLGTGAELAVARLRELETTLDNIDATLAEADIALASVDSAAVEFELLIEGEGAELVADARAAFASLQASMATLDQVAQDDVPAIVGDIRAAVAKASEVITRVGDDVTGFTGRLDPLAAEAGETLATATATLRQAGDTLTRIDAALEDASGALVAAESAFEGADAIINEEVAPTAADIRVAAASLSDAAQSVAADLPAITGELRAAIADASAVVARVDRAVAASAGPVEAFATGGLGQIEQFTREARSLVTALESLVRRIERDPARFFLGNQPPTYRR